jgi:hypothetical protein
LPQCDWASAANRSVRSLLYFSLHHGAKTVGCSGRFAGVCLWAILMVMVWLTVSGIWNVAPGRYTPVEVMPSVVIGLACLFGIVASVRVGYRPGWIRFGIFALWAIIQVCAMVVSFTRPIARDASFRAVFGL